MVKLNFSLETLVISYNIFFFLLNIFIALMYTYKTPVVTGSKDQGLGKDDRTPPQLGTGISAFECWFTVEYKGY